jgi:hypothetical protein
MEGCNMAAQTEGTDEVQTNEAETPDAVEDTNRSGCVMPLIHTSIHGALNMENGGHRVLITVDGRTVETPPLESLAFYAGLAALVGVGLVEMPVALVLGVGHALIDITHRPGIHALGEALQEA